MRHFDPDDPIWNEDEDRAAAYHESYEDWQHEEDHRPVLVTTDALATLLDEHGDLTLTVVGVAQDDGTIVIFTTAEGVNLAVDHRSAQHLVDLLQQDGEVPVLAANWQVL